MKKLGNFPRLVGYQYADQLAEHNVSADIVDSANPSSHYASHGTAHIELWVEAEDYDKALTLIQNIEREAQSRVNSFEQQVNGFFVRFFFILIILVLGFLLWRVVR